MIASLTFSVNSASGRAGKLLVLPALARTRVTAAGDPGVVLTSVALVDEPVRAPFDPPALDAPRAACEPELEELTP